MALWQLTLAVLAPPVVATLGYLAGRAARARA
jgi:hypothetical protein